MEERKKRMRKFDTLDRDRRWYELWKGGMTQAEIAEANDTNKSYVCQRINKHRDRVEGGSSRGDSYDIQAAAVLLVENDKRYLEKQLRDFIVRVKSGDFEDIAEIHFNLHMITSQFPRTVLKALDRDILGAFYNPDLQV